MNTSEQRISKIVDDLCIELCDPSPESIEFKKRTGLYLNELHLMAELAQQEEDARVFEHFDEATRT